MPSITADNTATSGAAPADTPAALAAAGDVPGMPEALSKMEQMKRDLVQNKAAALGGAK
eukprot:COSAG03_NODE_1869_length_3406_cov_4.948594_3_plen_59_part_00